MANPVIPAGMKPVVTGYQIGAAGGVIRTPVGGGRPRYALDWDRGVQQFQVTLILNAAQFSIWSVFYHRVIKKGAITFDMMLDSGLGPMTHAVNIVPDTYSVVRVGGSLSSVSFVVEAESSVYSLSDDDVELMFELHNLYGERLNRLFPRIEQFANVDTTKALK